MLRGVLGQRAVLVPAVRSSVVLGGVRTLRRRRGDDDDDNEEEAFLGENLGSRRPAGRGQGSYMRFMTANKETVLGAEQRNLSRWRERKDRRRIQDADGEDEMAVHPTDDGIVEDALGMKGQGDREGGEQVSQEDRRRQMEERSRRPPEDDDLDSFFDWEAPEMSMPGMTDIEYGEGMVKSDRIIKDDDERIRLGKLLWRRILAQAKDLDAYPTFAGSRLVRQAMKETIAAKEVLPSTEEEKEEEVKRLNAAKTVEEIDVELGRLIVLHKLDQQFLADDALEQALESPGRREGETQDEYLARRASRLLGDEYEDMDEQSLMHLLELKEATEEIPDTDYQEEGFEAFQQYADELARSGGVITYTYTAADKVDRKMKLPFPLGTAKVLKTSLDLDKKYGPLADRAPVRQGLIKDGQKVEPEIYGAHAWLALAKNPTMGETERIKFTESLMAKLRELQGDKPAPSKGGGGGNRAKGGSGKKQQAKG